MFNTANQHGAGSIPAGGTPTGIAIVPDQAPTASFLVTPRSGSPERRLTFQAGASRDPDGTIATYAWDWGDGKHAQARKRAARTPTADPAPTR